MIVINAGRSTEGFKGEPDDIRKSVSQRVSTLLWSYRANYEQALMKKNNNIQ